MTQRIEIAGDGDRHCAEAFGPNLLQPWAVRTNAHDFMSGRLLGSHEGENKMVEREIDGAELADFHGVTRQDRGGSFRTKPERRSASTVFRMNHAGLL